MDKPITVREFYATEVEPVLAAYERMCEIIGLSAETAGHTAIAAKAVASLSTAKTLRAALTEAAVLAAGEVI